MKFVLLQLRFGFIFWLLEHGRGNKTFPMEAGGLSGLPPEQGTYNLIWLTNGLNSLTVYQAPTKEKVLC